MIYNARYVWIVAIRKSVFNTDQKAVHVDQYRAISCSGRSLYLMLLFIIAFMENAMVPP